MAATVACLSLALAAPAGAVERGYAPVNGLELYYESHGNPAKDGEPLVLLHGGGSTIETSFGKLIPLVSKARQVIAFEQQGHGHTADVDRPFSFEQSAEDAVALLRYLQRRKGRLPRLQQRRPHRAGDRAQASRGRSLARPRVG